MCCLSLFRQLRQPVFFVTFYPSIIPQSSSSSVDLGGGGGGGGGGVDSGWAMGCVVSSRYVPGANSEVLSPFSDISLNRSEYILRNLRICSKHE